MKYLKKKEKKNPFLYVAIILIAAVIVLAILFLRKDSTAKQPEMPTEQTQTQETAEKAHTEETEPQIGDVVIETPYCNLHIPKEWEDDIRIEQFMFEVGMSAIFFGNVNGIEVELFAVNFGGSEGVPVGSITSPDGYEMDVTVQMADFTADDSWSAQDADKVTAMQECMNYVIEKLKQEPSITPADI